MKILCFACLTFISSTCFSYITPKWLKLMYAISQQHEKSDVFQCHSNEDDHVLLVVPRSIKPSQEGHNYRLVFDIALRQSHILPVDRSTEYPTLVNQTTKDPFGPVFSFLPEGDFYFKSGTNFDFANNTDIGYHFFSPELFSDGKKGYFIDVGINLEGDSWSQIKSVNKVVYECIIQKDR